MYNYHVGRCAVRFEWDPGKNSENIRKHGVSFEEATTVFLDEHAIEYFDPDHSEDEDRFLVLGWSAHSRALVVCYCHRKSHTVIRIISARKADSGEEKDYQEGIK